MGALFAGDLFTLLVLWEIMAVAYMMLFVVAFTCLTMLAFLRQPAPEGRS